MDTLAHLQDNWYCSTVAIQAGRAGTRIPVLPALDVNGGRRMTDRLTFDPPPGSPWRLLILDRTDPGDARWLILSAVLSTDVRPARLDADGSYLDWEQVTAWVRAQLGWLAEPVPVQGLAAWTIAGRTPQ
jgi:hypothetical protein